VQMNSARDDEECANNNDETPKLGHCMDDPITRVQSQNVIAAGDYSETGTEFRIMTFPMVFEDQRKNCNRRQQNSKRREERGMRFNRRNGHTTVTAIAIQFTVKQKRMLLPDYLRMAPAKSTAGDTQWVQRF